MATNLSFSLPNPMTRGIETFYTDLHSAMYDLGDLEAVPFPTAREFRNYLQRAFPERLAGLACLDAGCGATAINTLSLVRQGSDNLIAIDINEKSLEIARHSFAVRGLPPVAFRNASLLDLPFADESFDFIVCSGVVHHTPDPARAVQELTRVCRRGGRLYVSVYCFEGSWMHWAVRVWRALAWVVPFRLAHFLFKRSATINNFVLDHMYVPILWVYREEDFRRLLVQGGFTIDESFRSQMDTLAGRRFLGKTVSGDGLLRVFACTKAATCGTAVPAVARRPTSSAPPAH